MVIFIHSKTKLRKQMSWPLNFQDIKEIKKFMLIVFDTLKEQFQYNRVELEGSGDDYDETVKLHWEEKYGALNYYWELYDYDFNERCAGLSVICIPPNYRKYSTYRFQLGSHILLNPEDFNTEEDFFWEVAERGMDILMKQAELNFPNVRPRPLRGDQLEEAVNALKQLAKLKQVPGDHRIKVKEYTDELLSIFVDEKGLRYVPGTDAPYAVRKFVDDLKKSISRRAVEESPSQPSKVHELPRRAKDLPVKRQMRELHAVLTALQAGLI